MLRTHRAGKGFEGCGGWGLSSRNRRGPGVPPTPGLRGQGTSSGSPAGFLGSSGWGKCRLLLSCFSGLWGPLLPASPDLPCLPPMPPWPMQLGWGFETGVPAWGLSSLPSLSGPGDHPLLLSHSSWRVPPVCLSWSPWLQRHWSSLASSSPPLSVPLCPTGSLWGSSCLLVHQSPPPAAGRRPSFGETLTPCLPTPPSWLHFLLMCFLR